MGEILRNLQVLCWAEFDTSSNRLPFKFPSKLDASAYHLQFECRSEFNTGANDKPFKCRFRSNNSEDAPVRRTFKLVLPVFYFVQINGPQICFPVYIREG
jgi:hypothetical protein